MAENTMNKLVKSSIEYHLDMIGKINKTQEDLELVNQLMPYAYIWLDQDINVSFTVKSMDEVKEVLKSFAKNKILLKEFIKSDINPIWHLQGKNVLIRLNPNWCSEDVEGATCRLVQVGEETIKQPIYKLICSKGGKEINE